jgi:hypothetical protein
MSSFISTKPTNSVPIHLATKNNHTRDTRISFQEEGHKYTIDGVDAKNCVNPYTSVTTLVHQQFEQFDADKIITKMMASPKWPKNKYFGKTVAEIKAGWKQSGDEASSAGTKMHYDIECFYNGQKNVNISTEYKYFKNFYEDMEKLNICGNGPGEPYRTEWTVFDEELRLAGSIDMCFKKPDGSISIYDWKRCKEIKKSSWFLKFSNNPAISHIPDLNYWHYSLQLNIYKTILERKYEVIVSEMYLVCLHPNHMNYQRIEVTDMSREVSALVNKLLTK